ncbi:hypothetical protein K7W42_15640 [Deinococcus sp. HMF7604]|uniref:hypothetical protein n=1 Tax=Deinococcus betulae TaxID=2873312 RepID=UPI001CCDCD08|nr:hypothetical protein [Deinococcus betulae]MBZ9752285.1 hypothetical protein [Deinococcus betulae]
MSKTLMVVAGTQVLPDQILKKLQRHADVRIVVPSPGLAVPAAWGAWGRQVHVLSATPDTTTALVELAAQQHADALMTFDAAWSGPVSRAAAYLGIPGNAPDLPAARWQSAFVQAGGTLTDLRSARNLPDLLHNLSHTGVPALLRLPDGWGDSHHWPITADDDLTTVWHEWRAALSRLRQQGLLPFSAEPDEAAGIVQAQYPPFEAVVHVTGLVRDHLWTPVSLLSSSAQAHPSPQASLSLPCAASQEDQHWVQRAAQHLADVLGLRRGALQLTIGRDACNHFWLLHVHPSVSLDAAITTELSTGTDLVDLWVRALLDLPWHEGSISPIETQTAVGAVPFTPVDARGEPWRNTLRLNTLIDFQA